METLIAITSPSMLPVLIVLALIVYAVLKYIFILWNNQIKICQMQRLASQIPGPPVSLVPLIGNAMEFFLLPHHELLPLFTQWSSKFGSIFRVWVFNRLYLILASPESAQKILSSSDHTTKSSDYDVLTNWLGQGLLTSNGKKWFHRRKLLSNTFLEFKLLPGFCQVFNEQSNILLGIIHEKLQDTPSFDLAPYLRKCALDVICETGMNTNLGSQRNNDLGYLHAANRLVEEYDEYQKILLNARMTEIVYQKILEPWITLPILSYFLPIRHEEAKCYDVLHSFTKNIIKQRKQQRLDKRSDEFNNKSRKAFLDFLLDQVDNGVKLSDADLEEETNTFLFGGHDTIAANLSWTILLLGTHLEHQKKLQLELRKIFNDKKSGTVQHISLEDVGKMKYLDCCIKESLRIFPSVPAYNRLLQKDVLLDDGKILPAGAIASVNVFLLHKNPDYFPNPNTFDPDRFLPERCLGRHPFAYLPFSAGPRNCIGQKFAFLEEKIILAKLFWNFEIRNDEPLHSIKPIWDLVMRPMSGVLVSLIKRNG